MKPEHEAHGKNPLTDKMTAVGESLLRAPLVSVIVTAYNIAPYLGECIQSIQAQTHTNLEIIIVDDCSSDTSAEIAQSFAEVDPRIKLVRKPKNEGILYTKLDGIRHSTGCYFLLCDGDDWLSPHTIATCLSHAHGSECVIFGFNCVDHATRTPYPNIYPPDVQNKITQGIEISNFEWASISHIMPLYFYDAKVKGKLLEIYSGYPPLPYFDDLLAYALAMSFHRLKIIPDLLYQYRLNRPGQSIENWWHLQRSVKYLSLDTAIAATTIATATSGQGVQEIVFFKLLKIAFGEYRGILTHNVQEYPRLRRALLETLRKIKTPRRFFRTSPKAYIFLLVLRLCPPTLTKLVMPQLFKFVRI
ncbi:MAG TPA: glycosyltransferase family 2 protein [Rhodocyclaceae bacterium]